jgi:phosphoribosyl 1,2-cyclic phosphodiesterase
MARNEDFWVRFWGVRGTVPCPGPETVRYGGNTPCIEVMCGRERLIFDAGTGIRALGTSLASEQELTSHIFLTHTHMDHITGFPFFRPAYSQQNAFQIWAGHLAGQEGGIRSVLSAIMSKPIFPVPLRIMHACIAFHDFSAGETLRPLPGIVLRTAPLNHPNGATAYRIDYAGRSICYVTDTEHREGELDNTIVELIGGSQLVIYDATYTEEEYPRYRGWGHSTWNEGAKLCDAAGAGTLIAFHHDPDHTDADLDRIAEDMARVRPGSIVASEGLVLRP